MKRIYPLLLALCAVVALVATSHAQSLEDRLREFGLNYATGYTKPIGDAFGASLNSGWYSTANVSDGVDIFIGVKAMLLPIPDDARTFTMKSIWDGKAQVIPTVVGDKIEVPISNTGIFNGRTVSPETYAQGFDLKTAPMAVPHISIGNFFGTRLMIRWLPRVPVQNMGDFGFFGIGVQHSISRYVPALPVDLSAMVAYQSMTLGDIVTTKAFTIGAQVSKSFSILTLYGGLGYESSTMSFSYTANYTAPNPNIAADPTHPTITVSEPISFDLTGKNNFRMTVGFAVNLLILKINADYSLAAQPVATVGVGIGI
jgi:hypothetical protein